MAMQHLVLINLNIVGDGASTTWTFGFDELFDVIVSLGELIINPRTIPSSATVLSAPPGLTAPTASIDATGNLVLTFSPAWGNGIGGMIGVQLAFNSGSTSGATVAWTSATALNTAISVPCAGMGTALVTYNPVSSAFTAGTVVFEASDDGGTTWYSLVGERGGQQFTPDISYILNAQQQNWTFTTLGFTNFRTRLSVAILGSGTANFHVYALQELTDACQTVGQGFGKFLHMNIDGNPSGLVADVQAKGTQGIDALMVQNFKDAGRNYVSFTIQNGAGATSETLLSFVQNKQGTNTAAVTSYTVTSGKTLRITAISVSVRSAAAAVAWVRLALRHATGGATTNASPIAFQVPEVNTGNATSGAGAAIVVPIPDGIEFFGNGTQSIGMSQLAQATTNIINVTVYGYEY
jgi:hypothetical protein